MLPGLISGHCAFSPHGSSLWEPGVWEEQKPFCCSPSFPSPGDKNVAWQEFRPQRSSKKTKIETSAASTYLGLREPHTTMMNKATGTHSTAAFLVHKPRDCLCSKSPFIHSFIGRLDLWKVSAGVIWMEPSFPGEPQFCHEHA